VHIAYIPELEVLVVQIFLFIMLLLALGGLILKECYRLKRRWIKERYLTDTLTLRKASEMGTDRLAGSL
jgi:hypothetical protein